MCSVSFVMDHHYDKWKDYPRTHEVVPSAPAISQEEIEEFRKLLERAREYDRKMNQPDCELEEKRNRLKELANELGVEIAFL